MSELRVALIATLGLLGCDKPAPVTDVADPPPAAPAAAPQTAAQEAPNPHGGDTPDYAAFADDAWCPAAHADTVKIVEAMKATMKHAGRDMGGDDAYAPPELARYVELCQKLPVPMQKCLVVGYAARNRDACESALTGLDDAQRAAYGELMGK